MKEGFPPAAKITASGGFVSSFSSEANDIFDKALNEKIPKAFSEAVNEFPQPLGGGNRRY